MPSILIYPYRTPSIVSITELQWSVNKAPIDAADFSNVDYFTAISVDFECSVDVKALEESTGIVAADLDFVLSYRTDTVGFFTVLSRTSAHQHSIRLQGTVGACQLADQTSLEVLLIRRESALQTSNSLVARRAGAILWSTYAKLSLAGVGSRLSVTSADFSKHFFKRGAIWYVDLDRSDLNLSISSALQVQLNDQCQELFLRIQSSDVVSSSDRLVLCQMQLDVARQLVLAAREFAKELEEEPISLTYDSVGAVAFRCADRICHRVGLRSRDDLWSLIDVSPADFEVILQVLYLSPGLSLS